MQWRIEYVPELSGYTVEWAEPDNFFLSRRNILYHSRDLRPPFKRVAMIDAPLWRRAASTFRLAQRLLRFQVTNVIPLKNKDLFVTFDRSVGLIRDGKFEDIGGLNRPCRVLRSACAVDADENIFFGEYLANTERGEMRVYRYSAGGDALDIAYTFPAGSIRHIHGIYFDKFTKSLFCLTGDDVNECQISQSFDGFQTLSVIGRGDETWRAVSMLFTDRYLYYGMDAEFRENHVYKLDRQTSERSSLGKVNGTVFYSKQIGDDRFFTTTAENAPSQKENAAALWQVDKDDSCRMLVAFEKDRWNKTLFQFGTIHFPYVNRLDDALYFHLVGVKGDNQTYRLVRDS